MSLNTTEIVRARALADRANAADHSGRTAADDFSTNLFTGLNVAVFLVLAGCVVGAAVLYGLGA
jgi:hypothetical protein